MNQLKAKTTIQCGTCGCNLKRTKTFSVKSVTKEEAKIEAQALYSDWLISLKNQDCSVCKSIKKDLAA